MRTDLTQEIAGHQVRGVVTIGALEEMIGTRTWGEFTAALDSGDPRITRTVLRAALKAAGDLRPLEVAAEVDRLIEAAGVYECHAFALRLINDALNKAETARKNSPAAAPIEAAAATVETSLSE
jgi:hypothetical protein